MEFNELERQGNKQKEKESKNRKEKDVMLERVKGSDGLLSKNEEAVFTRGLEFLSLTFLLLCYRQLLVVLLTPSGAPLRPGFHQPLPSTISASNACLRITATDRN